jgi:hypothetical protein
MWPRVTLLTYLSKAYGDVKAASMAREHMQSWQQGRQIHHAVPISTQPTTAAPMASASASAQIPHVPIQRSFQIPKQDGTMAPLPHPQKQEWHSSVPVISTLERQAASPLASAAVPSTHSSLMHPHTNDSSRNTVVNSAMLNSADMHNEAEMQSHHSEVIADNSALTSTGLVSAPPALPSSQSGTTQSILLTSEDKGSPLYTMRGLAASIKRSLNAERLATSSGPSASSSSNGQKLKRSSSAEAIDDVRGVEVSQADGKGYEHKSFPKEEPRPVSLVSEPDDSRSTVLPASIPEDPMPQQETIPTPSAFVMPNPQHESTHNFVPFSTLTGAVSFDDISTVSANHNAVPPSEAMDVSEDLAITHPTPETVLHNPMEVPLMPIAQTSFEPLPFSHRTPTPPLAATITPLNDEDEGDEEGGVTPSSHPTSLLYEEVDPQLWMIPSGGEDDVEMHVDSGEGHVQAHIDIASPSEYAAHHKARDDNSPRQEADVFVRRTGLLDSSIAGIDRGSIGSLQAEDAPAGETSSSAQVSEALPGVPTKTSSTRFLSPGSAETSSSGLKSRASRRPRGKQEFYIAVPPPSEWVLRAKHREAERKALMNEKNGEP